MGRPLWDTAQELLAAWSPPGSEQTRRDENGWEWTERGHDVDLPRYQRAYDQLLWEIVTSSREELAPFAATLWSKPHLNLPPPLQVTIWRLLGLEAGEELEPLQQAAAGISFYCSPDEEAGAAQTIAARLRRLERG